MVKALINPDTVNKADMYVNANFATKMSSWVKQTGKKYINLFIKVILIATQLWHVSNVYGHIYLLKTVLKNNFKESGSMLITLVMRILL